MDEDLPDSGSWRWQTGAKLLSSGDSLADSWRGSCTVTEFSLKRFRTGLPVDGGDGEPASTTESADWEDDEELNESPEGERRSRPSKVLMSLKSSVENSWSPWAIGVQAFKSGLSRRVGLKDEHRYK